MKVLGRICGQSYLTSTICVFEILNEKLGSGSTDVVAVCQDFEGVRSLKLMETIALEAARLQDQLLAAGDLLAPWDLLIAVTARSTGDHFVLADEDFKTERLELHIQVTNLAKQDE